MSGRGQGECQEEGAGNGVGCGLGTGALVVKCIGECGKIFVKLKPS